MHDLPRRLALALLFVTGLSMLVTPLTGNSLAMQHHAALLILMGAALALAPWIAAVRLPAVAAALLSQLALLALGLHDWQPGSAWPLAEMLQALALAAAGVILSREARREKRWNLSLPKGN